MFRPILVACVALMVAGCSTWQVRARNAPLAAHGSLRTFAFGPAEAPPGGYQTPRRADAVRRVLEDTTARSLAARGYNRVDGAQTDLVVRFALGSRVDTRVAAVRTGAAIATEATARTETEGEWRLDLYDAASGRLVWHGTAHGDLDPADASPTSLHDAVEQILKEFPVASGA